MLIWRLIALASAILAFGGDVSAEGSTGTVVSCGSEKLRLTIQNQTGSSNRLSFEGATHDGNLLEKLSDLGQRTSHIAGLSCAEMAERDTTSFILLAFVREGSKTGILDEHGRPVRMKTVLIKFIGNRPHSYIEVETARENDGMALLPEYGLLSRDLQLSFEPDQVIDVSGDPEFFRTHSIVPIDPIRME